MEVRLWGVASADFKEVREIKEFREGAEMGSLGSGGEWVLVGFCEFLWGR